jgi:hypothetical protein
MPPILSIMGRATLRALILLARMAMISEFEPSAERKACPH